MPVDVIERDGFRATIAYDDDCLSPREATNVCVIYAERGTNLGDKEIARVDLDVAGVKAYIVDEPVAVFPLRCHDFRHISMWSNWDENVNAFAVITEQTMKDTGVPEDQFAVAVEAEIKEYNAWLEGDCYTVIIEQITPIVAEKGSKYLVEGKLAEFVEACGGFIGLGYAKEQAEEMLNTAIMTENMEQEEAWYWACRDIVTV